MVLRGGSLRPDDDQTRLLRVLQDEVFEGMQSMSVWNGHDLDLLRTIPLGVLRQGTVRRHGVTRWVRGARPDMLTPEEVRVIDLHSALLHPPWWAYARFVLHHAFRLPSGSRK